MSQPTIKFEPLVKSHWSETDKHNAKIVIDFIQMLMNDHNFDAIEEAYNDKPYTQHNRTIADGINGVIASVKGLVKSASEFSYDVKRIIVDNDEVVIHSHVTLKAKHRGDETQGFNIIDYWKVKDAQLLEHWDAVEGISFSMRMFALLAGGKRRNTNSIF